mgnify:CR=1 FL=1
MDSISKNEYLGRVSSTHMLKKHAVWCQCALTFYFTFFLSILSSFEMSTKDAYWGLVFIAIGCVKFLNAEHRGVFGLDVDTICYIHQRANAFIIGLIIAHGLFSSVWIRWVCPWVMCFLPIKTDLLLPVITFIELAQGYYNLSIIYTVVKLYPIHVVGRSMASIHQKQRFAQFSLQILIEALILWSYRCSDRFPFEFRWKSVYCSFFALCCACVYCSLYVAETKVSKNSIITINDGHGITASLTAALMCKNCASKLTSLDMEASYSD